MTGPCSRESVPTMVSALDAQANASGGMPSGAVARGDNSVNQCFPNEKQVTNIVTLRLEELGLVEIKLKTTISKEDYRACQTHLVTISGKICFFETKSLKNKPTL